MTPPNARWVAKGECVYAVYDQITSTTSWKWFPHRLHSSRVNRVWSLSTLKDCLFFWPRKRKYAPQALVTPPTTRWCHNKVTNKKERQINFVWLSNWQSDGRARMGQTGNAMPHHILVWRVNPAQTRGLVSQPENLRRTYPNRWRREDTAARGNSANARWSTLKFFTGGQKTVGRGGTPVGPRARTVIQPWCCSCRPKRTVLHARWRVVKP